MRQFLACLLLLFATPAGVAAQLSPVPVNPAQPWRPAPVFNPAAEYVTAGQDEPGYRRWVAAAAWRPTYVRAFHNYLTANGVAGVAPTWQLLRTASQWHRCAAEPFEVPPTSEWANIVATLNYVGSYIVPAIGPVEPVSVYRNPALNECAGGAAASTHREMGAIDLVPLRPISRQALMQGLCTVHVTNADVANAGLGFYKGVRFHIDSRNHREWGTQGVHGGIGCVAVLAESGIVVRRARPAIAAVPAPLVATSSATAKAAPAPTSAEKPVTLAPAVAAPPPVSSEIVPPSPVQTPVVGPAAVPLSPSPL
jgi:hypothetical protein